MTWDFEGRPHIARAGELSFTWPWQMHAAVNPTLPPVDIYWILLPLNTYKRPRTDRRNSVFLDMDLPHQVGYELVHKLSELPRQILKPKASFRTKFIQLVDQLHHTQGHIDLAAQGWLHLVLAEVLEAIRMAGDASEADETRERVERFLSEELPRCLEETWSLERMAEACDMGRTSFAEEVKRLKGDTPIRVLTRMRIECAKEQLLQTADSITDISGDCGFTTSQRFATVFKAYTGQSPREFRKHVRVPPEGGSC